MVVKINGELVGNGKASETSKKRKAIAENAVKESASYDWSELADNGKVMLKVYLFSCFNPVASSGPKKEKKILIVLISQIVQGHLCLGVIILKLGFLLYNMKVSNSALS